MLGCDAADPKARHAAYPVVDEAGRLLGLADAADVAAAVSPVASVHGQGAAGAVRDVMDQQVASVRAGQVRPRPRAHAATEPPASVRLRRLVLQRQPPPPPVRGCAALRCRMRSPSTAFSSACYISI
jgi:hypothetical protein